MSKQLKPFQRVLVRGGEDEEWVCGIYSHYDSVLNSHCAMGAYFKECIPYEGNEHLLGTNDSPKPKRWRAEEGEQYWYVNSDAKCYEVCDCRDKYDNDRHSIGNYFRTKEEAEGMAQRIKQLMKGE